MTSPEIELLSTLKSLSFALDFAAKKHRDQRRKDHAASPYINHPIALVQILINEGQIVDPHVIVAALLHDTIEDTDTTPEEIESHFGPKIRSIVEEVTDDQKLPKEVRKALQIQHAPNLSPEAALVKLADKIANLRDLLYFPPLTWTPHRKKDYCEWAQKVIHNISRPEPKLLDLFQSTVQQVEQELANNFLSGPSR